MKLFPYLLGSLLAVHVARPVAAWQEDDEGTRFFALPMVRDTRELAATAENHLQAGRFREAAQTLQRILEDHAREVLPAADTGKGGDSTFTGAAEWALERMFALPASVRQELRERYEPRAREALVLARQGGERGALVAIERRWPLTRSAVEALLSLGDLELECGQAQAAGLAWNRALENARRLELELGAGTEARRAWLAARAPLEPARRSPARGSAVPWVRNLDLAPFTAQPAQQTIRCLQPVYTGDLVLVNSTLRMYALDALTGELRWQAGPPRGWSTLFAQRTDERLFKAINTDQLWLAPAWGAGVALAVMQEPFAENENEDWQGIDIMKAIPERRLHAFDLATGRPLWDHSPEVTFDGLRLRWDGSGTYAQRMMVAGTPVVAGARVLVPCYRMQGRIDYHVACYELTSGELLWSTQVLSGQRERNMFGRSVLEFCASPLAVVGDRVVAQTELGTLAALDLVSGRILWETTYRQIALPRTHTYQSPQRRLTWRLAPPAIVGDVVVATPSDSEEIFATRLSDGAWLWAYAENALQALDHRTVQKGFNLLLGADEDKVYLSGGKVSALQKPGGLAGSAPFLPRWTRELSRPETSPRAVLCDDSILSPAPVERTAFDLRTGEERLPLKGDWAPGDAGNVAVGDGALFSLSATGLAGYFDWQAQLERARSLAQGGEVGPLRAAAQLFQRRGEFLLASNDAEGARPVLAEARTFHARLRTAGAPTDAHDELACARNLAECLGRLQRVDEALATLEDVRSLAGEPGERIELLYQEQELLRGGRGSERLAVLEELEALAGTLPVPAERLPSSVARWLAATAQAERIAPDPDPLPTHVWVACEAALEHERQGDLAAALDDLHVALSDAGTLQLARGLPLAAFLGDWIGRLLAFPGGREAYVGIEARADAELERAGEDPSALEAITRRFPHSRAAEDALGKRIVHAADSHDAAALVELVRGALEQGGLPAERERALLLSLARTLGRLGNAALERGLVGALARGAPEASDPSSYGGRPLAAVAAELAAEASGPVTTPVTFDAGVVSTGRSARGPAEFLGRLTPARTVAEGAPVELHLYAQRDELVAYSSDSPGEPLWHQPFERTAAAVAFAPGRFLYGNFAGITCLDEQGRTQWTQPTPDDSPAEIVEHGGVLVALLRSGSALALDSVLGLPLWKRSLPGGEGWKGLVAGDGHVVLVSRTGHQAPRALALDLYRGKTTADIRLEGFDARIPFEDAAWISAGRLIAPAFQQRPTGLTAFELEGGARAWSLEFGRDEELYAVAHFEGRAFPITLANTLDGPGNGGVHELDPELGTTRRLVPLKKGERIMGIDSPRSVELPAPYLFAFMSSADERSVPIRAIHLLYGTNEWTWSLPISPQEVYDGRTLPMPAVSADCVAIAYQTRRAGSRVDSARGSEATTIVFVDKRGRKIDTALLGDGFGHTTRLELHGLGSCLFLLGRSGAPSATTLDILGPLR